MELKIRPKIKIPGFAWVVLGLFVFFFGWAIVVAFGLLMQALK